MNIFFLRLQLFFVGLYRLKWITHAKDMQEISAENPVISQLQKEKACYKGVKNVLTFWVKCGECQELRFIFRNSQVLVLFFLCKAYNFNCAASSYMIF